MRQKGRGVPGLILPGQFQDLFGSHSFSSEQRLMLAVLGDAINSLLAPGRVSHTMAAEAADWIYTSRDGPPLSFERVCEALAIEPSALRERLAALSQGRSVVARPRPGRLRLKEASRAQHLTVKRVRRRGNRPTRISHS
jgi:hypothetical protein